MKIDEFKDKYIGKQVEYHSYGAGAENQCVDLVNKYIADVLGLDPILGTHAKDFAKRYNKNQFSFVPNTPDGLPKKGDIVVWGAGAGGGYGHVAIFFEGTTGSFRSLDQNWSVRERVTYEDHRYNNVVGWLTPLNTVNEDFDPKSDISGELEDLLGLKKYDWYNRHWSLEDLVQFAARTVVSLELSSQREQDLENQLKNSDTTLSQLKKDYSELASANIDLVDENTELKNLINKKEECMNQPLIESIREFGRVGVLAVIPVIATSLENPEMGVKAVLLSAGIALLKALDKFVHEKGKAEKSNLVRGLTRF